MEKTNGYVDPIYLNVCCRSAKLWPQKTHINLPFKKFLWEAVMKKKKKKMVCGASRPGWHMTVWNISCQECVSRMYVVDLGTHDLGHSPILKSKAWDRTQASSLWHTVSISTTPWTSYDSTFTINTCLS